jgi:hypothetical protein
MASPTALVDKAFDYIMLTNFLGVLRNDKKDRTGLVVEVLSYKINTIQMTVYLLLWWGEMAPPPEKVT